MKLSQDEAVALTGLCGGALCIAGLWSLWGWEAPAIAVGAVLAHLAWKAT